MSLRSSVVAIAPNSQIGESYHHYKILIKYKYNYSSNNLNNVKMEHKHEDNIICPYCNYEDQDSWEFQEESGTQICGSCEKEFNVSRDIEVTYSTSRIDCEENGKEHDYKLEKAFSRKLKYDNRVRIDLPENEWSWYKVMECVICGDKEYVDIAKEEYEIINKLC